MVRGWNGQNGQSVVNRALVVRETDIVVVRGLCTGDITVPETGHKQKTVTLISVLVRLRYFSLMDS